MIVKSTKITSERIKPKNIKYPHSSKRIDLQANYSQVNLDMATFWMFYAPRQYQVFKMQNKQTSGSFGSTDHYGIY